jgi:hypothetical protein
MEAASCMKATFCAAIGVVLSVTGASATLVKAEYTGTVIDGNDGSGFFSSVGADLSGLAFTADFLFNTATGTWVSRSATLNDLKGGPGSGYVFSDSPMLEASLTIKGITYNFATDFLGEIFGANGQTGVANQQYHKGEAGVASISARVFNKNSQISGDIPATIDAPFTFSLGPDDAGSGMFIFGSGDQTYGDLAPTALTYTVASRAVPELSTWAMMLAGFAGLGFAGYRAARKNTAAA